MMKQKYKIVFVVASIVLTQQIAIAANVVELPLFNLLQGIPEKDNRVGGYVSIGTFRDDLPAIQVVSEDVAQFFVRNTTNLLDGDREYDRWEIHCSSGAHRITGTGPWQIVRRQKLWEEGRVYSIDVGNPKNKKVYKKICNEAGFFPKWK